MANTEHHTIVNEGSGPRQVDPAGAAPVPVAINREMDVRVNPYAAALHGPAKSKRDWNANHMENFQKANSGDPVRFELTNGVMAEGIIKIVQNRDGVVTYVSGELTAPETGKFFFLTPPAGGKAGRAVGVVEFPESATAYRVEPTGINGEPQLMERRMDEVVCTDMPAVDPAKLKQSQGAERGRAQSDAIIGIVQRWGQIQPEETGAWVDLFPSGELKQTASENLEVLGRGATTR